MAVTLNTSLGEIKLEIFCEEVPRTAENFLALCASGYYNNSIFHRNIRGFMIQGGDPTGTGKGGKSIYGTANGKFADEIRDTLKHSKRGIVSMANSGKYTVFGQVIDGMEVLDRMEKLPTGPGDRPMQEIKLTAIQVHANPLAG